MDKARPCGGTMLKLRSLVVLAVTTWTFVVCFAVWLMFGVTGIPISRELNLNGIQFGLLTSTPVLTGALSRLPLGIWTDRFGGRIVMFLLLVVCAVPLWLSSYAERVLAVPPAWVGSRRRRSLLRRRHALRRALFPQGAARLCHGRVRRRHHRRADQHVHRSGPHRPIWLQGRSQGLSRRAARHGGDLLAAVGAGHKRARQERRVAAAAIGGIQGPARLEVLPVLLDRFWRLHRAVRLDAAILRERVRAEHCTGFAAGRVLFPSGRDIARCRPLPSGSLRRTQSDVVGIVGGLDQLFPPSLSADRLHHPYDPRPRRIPHRIVCGHFHDVALCTWRRICVRNGIDLQVRWRRFSG